MLATRCPRAEGSPSRRAPSRSPSRRAESSVESAPGAGTAVHVLLPRIAESRVSPETAPEPPPPSRAAPVLLAEDDPAVRTMAEGVLKSAGYEVLATDGEEALAVMERHDGAIDVLLTDIVMPRLSGPRLARRVLARRPGV